MSAVVVTGIAVAAGAFDGAKSSTARFHDLDKAMEVAGGAAWITLSGEAYFARYPDDRQRARDIFERLENAIDSTESAKAILRVIDALDDQDDVQDVYANFDIPDSILESIEA